MILDSRKKYGKVCPFCLSRSPFYNLFVSLSYKCLVQERHTSIFLFFPVSDLINIWWLIFGEKTVKINIYKKKWSWVPGTTHISFIWCQFIRDLEIWMRNPKSGKVSSLERVSASISISVWIPLLWSYPSPGGLCSWQSAKKSQLWGGIKS